MWGPNGENSVGLLQDVGLRVRYTYDQCFDGTRTNQQASRAGSWHRRGGVSCGTWGILTPQLECLDHSSSCLDHSSGWPC